MQFEVCVDFVAIIFVIWKSLLLLLLLVTHSKFRSFLARYTWYLWHKVKTNILTSLKDIAPWRHFDFIADKYVRIPFTNQCNQMAQQFDFSLDKCAIDIKAKCCISFVCGRRKATCAYNNTVGTTRQALFSIVWYIIFYGIENARDRIMRWIRK